MTYCSNCGAGIAEGAAFCPNCGQGVAREAAASNGQGGGTSDDLRASSQKAAAASATQAPPSVGSGAPPVVASPPPQAPPPSPPGAGGKKSRKGLIIGGIAAVGLLGFLALLVVGALAYFFLLRPTPQPEPGPEPGPQPQQPEKPGDPQPPPQEGALQGIVQEQVGDFQLQEVAEFPEAIEAGATEALKLTYAGPQGEGVAHTVAAMPAPEAAEEVQQASVDSFAAEGFAVLDEQPIEIEGEQVGIITLLQGEIEGTPVTATMWSNGILACSAVAPGELAADFYNSSAY